MSSLSYGYNVRSERLRVMGLHELLAFLLLIAVVCWMIFPRDLSTTLRNARLDAVTFSYMQAWLKAKPNDDELRLLMARELILLGRFREAEDQLALIAGHGHFHDGDGAWLRLLKDFYRLMAVPPRDRIGTMLEYETVERLNAVDWGALTREQREEFAEMALALNQAEAAANAYARIAVQSDTPAQWHERAACVQLAHGNYQAAATSYIRAMDARGDYDVRKTYFLSAMDVLVAGGLHGQALALAERRERSFLDDKEVVYRLMLLAQSGGDMTRAQRYAVILLNLPGAEASR